MSSRVLSCLRPSELLLSEMSFSSLTVWANLPLTRKEGLCLVCTLVNSPTRVTRPGMVPLLPPNSFLGYIWYRVPFPFLLWLQALFWSLTHESGLNTRDQLARASTVFSLRIDPSHSYTPFLPQICVFWKQMSSFFKEHKEHNSTAAYCAVQDKIISLLPPTLTLVTFCLLLLWPLSP